MRAGKTSERLDPIRPLFLAIAALLVVSVTITYLVGLRAVKLNADLASQSHEIRQLDAFVSTVKDAETGQRGYLLTGEDPYLEPYQLARANLNQQLIKLEQLASSGELPPGDTARLASLAQQKLAELQETIELRKNRRLDAALAIVRSDRGKQLMDQLRALVAQMTARMEARWRQSSRRAAAANLFRTATYIGTALVNLVFLVWFYARLRLEINRKDSAVTQTQTEKELLAITLASIGDAVVVTDAQGRITSMNREAERMTAWDTSQARGKQLTEVFKIYNERTGQPVENPVDKVLRLGTIVGLANHTVLLSRNGKQIPIGDSGAPVRHGDGPIEGVVLVFRDVTDERKSQLTNERLAAIVESSPDAIISKTIDGTIRTWNAGAERIFGHPAADAIGRSISIIVPPGLKDEELRLREQVTHGQPVEYFETVRLARDGRPVNVSLAMSPLKDDDDQVVGISKVLRDITAQKNVEKQLLEARQQLEIRAHELETAVSARTRELRGSVAELEAFCYSLSHDMRTPLRAIQSYSELVLLDQGNELNTHSRDHLSKVIGAAQRMDQLIQDVLTLTRLSNRELAPQPLDVDRLARDIVHERSQLLPVNADIRVESPLLGMRGHAASLTQCVTNLLDNAIKFVAPGVKPRVRVFTQRSGNQVRLCIADNGIGIEKHAQQRLFGLFQRMHRSDAYEGTGIGLAIVRKAAERMGGQVGCHSEKGQGSTFWVELPATGS